MSATQPNDNEDPVMINNEKEAVSVPIEEMMKGITSIIFSSDFGNKQGFGSIPGVYTCIYIGYLLGF